MGAPKDLVGQVFGYLTVIEKTDQRDSSGSIRWRCVCKCGTPVIAPTRGLTSGNYKSCGCRRSELAAQINHKDLTGMTFGRLTVLRKTEERRNGCVMWECKCECGNIVVVRAASLNYGTTKSCGCYNGELAPETLRTHVAADHVADTKLSYLTSVPPSNNTSGVRGVTYHKASGRWVASIGFRKKVYYLGLYKDKADAIKARQTAEDALWKPFLEELLGEYSSEQDLQNKLHSYLKARILEMSARTEK